MDIPDIQEILTKELNLDSYTKEEQESILSALGGVIMKRALIDLTVALPEEKRDEFLSIVEGKDPKTLGAFVEKNLPSFETIVQKAVHEEVRLFLDAQAKGFDETKG